MDKIKLPSSERLLFKTWKEQDLELAIRLWGDIKVTKYIGGPYKDKNLPETGFHICSQYWGNIFRIY